jgi:hypothetical protein
MRETGRDVLFADALEEYQVTRQIATGIGPPFLNMCGLRGEGPPEEFIAEELGYDGPVGFRLREMVPQAELDERHQAAQVPRTVAAPSLSVKSRKKMKRETKGARRAKLEQLEIRALLRLGRAS